MASEALRSIATSIERGSSSDAVLMLVSSWAATEQQRTTSGKTASAAITQHALQLVGTLAKRSLKCGTPPGSTADGCADATSAALLLIIAIPPAALLQKQLGGSDASTQPSKGLAVSSSTVKEIIGAAVRSCDEVLGAVLAHRAVVGSFTAPALACLAAAEAGLRLLPHAFRRLALDVIFAALEFGRVELVESVASDGEDLRAVQLAGAGAISAALASLALVRRSIQVPSVRGGSAAPTNVIVYEPAPYFRAGVSIVEDHLRLARQLAARVPTAAPAASGIVTAFAAAGDAAGHAASALSGSSALRSVMQSATVAGKPPSWTDAVVRDAIVGAIITFLHVLATLVRSNGAGHGGTTGVPLAALLALVAESSDVTGLADGGIPPLASRSIAHAALELLVSLIVQARGGLRRYRAHVMRLVVAGVRLAEVDGSSTALTAEDNTPDEFAARKRRLAVCRSLVLFMRHVGVGVGSVETDNAVASVLRVALEAITRGYLAPVGAAPRDVMSAAAALSVLHGIVVHYGERLQDAHRLVIERLALRVVSGHHEASEVATAGATDASSSAYIALPSDDSATIEPRTGGTTVRAIATGNIAAMPARVTLFAPTTPLLTVAAPGTAVVHPAAVAAALEAVLMQCLATPWQCGAASPIANQLRRAVSSIAPHARYSAAGPRDSLAALVRASLPRPSAVDMAGDEVWSRSFGLAAPVERGGGDVRELYAGSEFTVSGMSEFGDRNALHSQHGAAQWASADNSFSTAPASGSFVGAATGTTSVALDAAATGAVAAAAPKWDDLQRGINIGIQHEGVQTATVADIGDDDEFPDIV